MLELTIEQVSRIAIDSFIDLGNGDILLFQEVYLYDLPDGNYLELIGLNWSVLQ